MNFYEFDYSIFFKRISLSHHARINHKIKRIERLKKEVFQPDKKR